MGVSSWTGREEKAKETSELCSAITWVRDCCFHRSAGSGNGEKGVDMNKIAKGGAATGGRKQMGVHDCL